MNVKAGVQDRAHLELPTFEHYIIEGIEGSGGYGIVYRAQRKSDGCKFAIKYPNPNAIKQHVDNERTMLERFGGMNFVMKYEGPCRSENTECILLKHVEHDYPRVLIKEIVIFEVQWYAYCLFTALARLHKRGVVHRDVKPGNFLFSRKTCVGYLSDFNFAMVLHEKKEKAGQSKNKHEAVCMRKKRKIMKGKAAGRGSKMEPKVSYIKNLSVKDFRGSREKLREPLPCQGRKELINLIREAAQTPQIKQVQGQVPKKGPCVGTKGFRAPEVLLRSIHQGCQLDVWSAGVTLLFLLTGRLPFTGEPQQNINDIVKLRGSKQIVELAKLHKCELSLPAELLNEGLVESMELRDWCNANTKRPDLMATIPESMFDLLDKCLTINPRCRITAKEALKHEFFGQCVKAIGKERAFREQKRKRHSLDL